MSGKTRPFGRVRVLDVVVLLVVIAAFAVGAHILGFGPFADSRSSADRVDANVDVTESHEEIAASQPLEMAIPALGLRTDIDSEACPLEDGALDPPTLDTACYYVAEDRPYSLPGTDVPDLSVLAGHAASGRDAVFNDLYDNGTDTFTLEKGDELLVRTRAGEDRWLVYEATDFHNIDKASLGGDAEVWGDGPMPGRMLTISCIQSRNPFASATHNVIVGWTFAGLADAPAV